MHGHAVKRSDGWQITASPRHYFSPIQISAKMEKKVPVGLVLEQGNVRMQIGN
jgi:hypothetical protein